MLQLPASSPGYEQGDRQHYEIDRYIPAFPEPVMDGCCQQHDHGKAGSGHRRQKGQDIGPPGEDDSEGTCYFADTDEPDGCCREADDSCLTPGDE